MNIYVVCPAHVATGGTEALHAFVALINKIKNINARIWYWNINGNNPRPEEFQTYHCEYVTHNPDDMDAIIVPEIWANEALKYNCVRAIYWLGVDAYAGWTLPEERGSFLKDQNIIHIAQSDYAWDFLSKLRVKHLIKCTDIVNIDYYADFPEEERNNTVLYNPAKATPFLRLLMDECSDIDFRPIANMTRKQVIDTMRHSKLYIDFGEFPGRERIPREAVLCGCCLITGKIGSAGYEGDFMHAYKYDSKSGHIWAIRHAIHYVLDHYEECRKDFDAFRDLLKLDAEMLGKEAKEVAREIQHHHTGLQRRGKNT